jgi:hypothetical protein
MIKYALAVTALATMSLAALALPVPVMAQGTVGPTPATGQRVCPSGYVASLSNGRSDKICYPNSGARPVYSRASGEKCADGYEVDKNWCIESSRSKSSSGSGGAVYQPLARGSFKKADPKDRCPVGYWTTQDDIGTCASPSSAKIPATRLKGSSACGANEVDEWGLYCTSKETTMTRREAEDIAAGDVNNYYVLSGGGNAKQGYDYANTPGIVGIYGKAGGAPAPTSANAAASSSEESKPAPCETSASGSAAGAAVGGAVAGDAGAVLGSMLGGLGKKKKKKAAGC